MSKEMVSIMKITSQTQALGIERGQKIGEPKKL
jgi:hypothetical protein